MQNDVSGRAVLALTAHVSADLCRGVDADAFGEGVRAGFLRGIFHGHDGVCALGNSSARHDAPCGTRFKNVGLVISCRDVASDRDGDGVLRGGLEIVIEVKCVAIHSRI